MREYFVIDNRGEMLNEIFYSYKEAALYAAKMNREAGDKNRFRVQQGSVV